MSLKKTAKNLLTTSLVFPEQFVRRQSGWPDPQQIHNVLLLEYMLPLGCCVHLTPLYEAVKTARPGIALTVATRGLGLALLRHNPSIDGLIETLDPLADTLAAARSLRASLRERNLHPDCILTGASDQRTRIALLSLLTGGPRGGYTLATELYVRPLQYERDRSLIANNLALLSLLGIAPSHFEPRVFFSQANVEAATKLADAANPGGRPLVIFVTQNSRGQRTGWHKERFAQVIRHAEEVLGCAIAYVGTAGDSGAIQTIREAADGIGTSFAGQTSVTELAALLALSDAVVSLDTGTMHIGRAVGVPMVVIGPSWQRPTEWLPLGQPQVRILRGKDRDDVPPDYRLDEVEAIDVIAALEELLTSYPPGPEARDGRIKVSRSTVDHAVAHRT